MKKINKQAVLVLGANGYLGKEISSQLEVDGYIVFRAGRGCQETELQPNLDFDLSDQKMYFSEIEKIYNLTSIKISAIINCAGISKRISNINQLNSDSDEIIKDLSIDTKILLNTVLFSIDKRSLFEADLRIIDIGSIWAHKIPYPPIYLDLKNVPDLSVVLSKSIKLRIVEYFAQFSLPIDFKINQISPGWFPRPRTEVREDYIKNINNRIPLSRIGKPEDLFSAINFLLDPKNSYCNGIEIIIDGGHHIY